MIVLIGESGSGKSLLERELESIGTKRVISYTSRPARESETDGVHYHFVARSKFEALIVSDFFAEWVEYNGNLYGTAKSDCIDDSVIIVEPEGLKQLQEKPDLKTISFYLQASEAVRMARMIRGRGDTEDYAIDRIEKDRVIFKGIDKEVDYVVDANMPVYKTVAAILSILTKGVRVNESDI